MILEGAFELRTAKECSLLKEKEKCCLQELGNAAVENEKAWELGDEQAIDAAERKMEKARQAHKAVEGDLAKVAQTLMFFVLDALKEGKCVNEGGICT